MATYVYNGFQVFAVIPFDPYRDVLSFVGSPITSFAQIVVVDDNDDDELPFLTDERFIFLRVDEPLRFVDTNFLLPDGGMILIGDNSNAWRDDNLANTILGGAGGDFIAGFDGADSISAGGGNDFLVMFTGKSNGLSNGSFGADTIDGGAGFDIIRFPDVEISGNPNTYQAITANLGGAANAITAGTFGSVTIIGQSIEGIVGGEGNDSLTGNTADNFLVGGGGNDVLFGADGADTISGSFGNDSVDGGAGNDFLRGSFGGDSVAGGAGNDTFRGGGFNNETVDGGTGIDLLQVGQSYSIQTDTGRTFTDLENLTLISDAGLDSTEGALNNLLSGNSDGDDNPAFWLIPELSGNALGNVLTGNDRVNFFLPGAGNDTIKGGGGLDMVQFDGPEISPGVPGPFTATGALTITFTGGGNGTVSGSGLGNDVLEAVEGAVGGQGNDTITGGAGNDDQLLAGASGSDTISGGGGNDTLFGDTGNDTLDGGAGSRDLAGYMGSDSGIIANLSGSTIIVGTNTVLGGTVLDGNDSNDTLAGIQSYTDTLTNIEGIAGGTGNDWIVGSSGDNRLWGGGSNDTITGGTGNDTIDGGFGIFDTSVYTAVTQNMTVNLATGTVSIAGGEVDSLVNIEQVLGGSGNDTMLGGGNPNPPDIYFWTNRAAIFEGGGGNDFIDGVDATDGYYAIALYGSDTAGVNVNLATGLASGTATGNDTLANIDAVVGGSGNDTLVGGSSSRNIDGVLFEFFNGGLGADSIDGGSGIDRVDYNSSPSAVLVDLGNNTASGGHGNDSFSNIEGVRGSFSNDTLLGSGGDNLFEGMGGNDSIDGGGGNDIARYDRSTSGVTVNLSTDTAADGFGGTDALLNIEAASGTDFSDFFVGQAGQNNFFDGRGGARQDTQSFAHSDTVDYGQGGHSNGITVNLATGLVNDGLGGTDTLVNIEAVWGTNQNDSMVGSDTSPDYDGLLTTRVERFRGGLGNDTIDGGGSQWGNFDLADYSTAGSAVFVNLMSGMVSGGAGNDLLINIYNVVGSSSADNLQGGGDSRTYSGSLFEVFRGGGGNDSIYGNDGFDFADYTSATSNVTVFLSDDGSGGFANDGQGGTDQLSGIEGLRGGQFNDQLHGSDNDLEIYEGNAGDDFIDGSGGLDITSYRTSSSAVYVDLGHSFAFDGWGDIDFFADVEGAYGSDFNDTLIGGYSSGQDFDGWQVFDGRAGNDLIDGADDFNPQIPGAIDNDLDAAEYSLAPSAVYIDLVGGTANDGYGGVDTLSDIEIGVGSRFGDTIIGGNVAHDRFEGFEGRAGNDSMVGGSGNDWLMFEEVQEGVAVDLSIDRVLSDGWDSDYDSGNGITAGTDTITGMEHVFGSSYDDTIVGSAADNFLHGDDGEDCVRGGAGNDSLDGGDGGADGQGDVLEGGHLGKDFADYSTTANAVDVNLATGDALAGADGNDLLTDIEAVRGSAFNDTLTGDAWDGLFEGGAGDDSIDGGGGPDWASYEHDTGGVLVNLATQTATDGFGDTDTLRSIDHVLGSASADTLTGSSGDNTIEGGDGNDLIDGLGGFDTVSYRGASGGVTINLAANSAGGAAGNDTLSNVENAIGSEFADTITGAAIGVGERQFLQGGGGADSITGNTSDGGLSILSLDDDDRYYFIDFSSGSGSVLQQDGSTLYFSGIEGVVGGSQWDSLTGGAGNDYFEGGRGWDSIVGGEGTGDLVSYHGANNPVVVNLSAGQNTIANYIDAEGSLHSAQTLQGGQVLENYDEDGDFSPNFDSLVGIEAVEGSNYNDTMFGNAAAQNTIEGGAGNDQFFASGGTAAPDSMDGGSGVDQVNYFNNAVAIVVNLLEVNGSVAKGTNTDWLTSIEQVTGSNGFADTMIGSNQVYTGRFHDYTFQFFSGVGGNDSIVGGSADGQYTGIGYTNANAAISGNLGANTAGGANHGTDTFSNIDELIGSNFADTLTGGGSSKGYSGQLSEFFRGGAGNDSIDGLSGEDRVDYRASTGAVNVTLGNGTQAGGASDGQGGTDTLKNVENVRGSIFSDVLTGGGTQNAGTIYDYEVFEGLEGNDTINGLGGNDIANYAASDAGILANLTLGFALDGFGTRDTLISIEQVNGSDYGDVFVGTNSLVDREAFRGGAGNDTIDGGAGNDAAFYNASPTAVLVNLASGIAQDGYGDTDTLINIEAVRGSIHADTLLGGEGNESFEGIQGADSIDGGGGGDRVDYYRDQGAVTVTFTGVGTGTATGALSGTDTFVNIEGVRGTLGFGDTLTGGAGNETLDGAGGNDSLVGGTGNDFLSFRSAIAGVNVSLANTTVTGTAGNDSYGGFEGISGSDFADTLAGGIGNDTLIGGLGNDAYTVGAGDAIVEATGEGFDVVNSSADYVLGDNIENLTLTGTSSISGAGNALANLITGNAGNNVLDGGAGNDTMVGGAGNDTYFVDRASDVITEVAANGGIDTVILSAGFNPSAFIPPHGASADVTQPGALNFTLAANLENATVTGSDTKVNVTANAAANFLVGGVNNDTLDGGAGNDTLQGLEGVDKMIGGTGNDTYFVRQVGEQIVESTSAGTDTVISSIPVYNLAANAENLTLADDFALIGTIKIAIGNDLNNYIKGNNLDNSLLGGLGNDTIEGGGGSDRLIGGAGSDSYVIDGSDIIIEVGGSAADKAKVTTSVNLGASAGIENAEVEAGRYGIAVTGNKQGNAITGNETSNTLNGGKGDKGDSLIGGAGSDIYIINSTLDKITDTEGGADAIQTDFNMSLAPFATVENLYFVGTGNTVGVGNASANLMRGNAGNNLLSGMDNADDLEGAAGNDTLDGGKGADRLYGGAGDDTYVLDDAGDKYFETVRVELASPAGGTGTPAFGFHPANVISADGRYLLFYSTANGLVTGDTNNVGDSFVRDMLTGTLTRVSVGPAGQQLTTNVLHSSINPGGRFVAFTTTDNLLATDLNSTLPGGGSDVYLRDWNGTTPATTLLSVGIDGKAGNGASVMSDVSSDGRFVVISSLASNLVAVVADNPETTEYNESTADIGGFRDIFVVDRVANTIVRASVGQDGSGADADSDVAVSIAANGRYVAFSTTATNLLTDDTSTVGPDESDNNGLKDVYLRDIAGLATERISIATGDGEADGASGNARISIDGRFVVFESLATNLVANDTSTGAVDESLDGNAFSDVFVRDRQSGSTVRVSTDSMGGSADGASSVGGISGDGRYVVFQSAASDLVAGDTNGLADVFVKDLQSGAVVRVSGVDGGLAPDISEDGRYIVFTAGTDLVRIANPLIMGQSGIDTIKTPFSTTLTGEFENLVLTGTAAISGTGNDLDNILDGSQNTAANTLTGGLGNDTYIVGAGDIVAPDADGIDGIVSTVNITIGALGTIENLTLAGTAGSGTGNGLANIITGNAANNTLDGGLGNDTLIGGAGNDLYLAQVGDSIVELANGGTNDTVQITGSSFDLSVFTAVENVVLLGGGGFNATGNIAANKLTGDGSANVLDGGLGNDTLIGAGGNDTYVVDVATDVITETGTDTGDTVVAGFSTTLGATLEHLVLVGAENLTGTGNASVNSMTGNTGNNLLDGKAGADILAGGSGNDTYMADNAGDQAIEGLDAGLDTVLASASFSLLANGANVENLTLTAGDINGTGNALDNLITGSAGKNSLAGGDGNDTLVGGAGIDTMAGGDGNDLFFVDATGDVVGDTTGFDTVSASANYTLTDASLVEDLVLTGTAASGTGNSTANRILGNSANNTLSGGGGADTLIGGAGNDVYVAENVDSLVELSGGGTDLVQASASISIAGWENVENLALTAAGNFSGTGNALNNLITAVGGHNTLDGGLGSDTLVGGDGNDYYKVDAAGDVITETATGGTDTVESTISYTLAGTLEHLVLEGGGDINGAGNINSNAITGNGGNNYLLGGAGNDTLVGGAGDFDVADYAGTTGAVTVTLGGTSSGTAGIDSVASDIEGVRGGQGNDSFIGSGALNEFVDFSNATGAVTATLIAASGAGIGSDSFINFEGIRGSTFNDNLTGNTGNNFFFANQGDTVAGDAGNDTVYASNTFSLAASGVSSIEDLTLVGALDANASGDGGNNAITGNAGNNYLAGGAGNDTLDGGGGLLDVADYVETTDGVTVNLVAGTASGASSGSDSIAGGIEGVRGGTGNDTLTGSAATNEFVDYSGASAITIDLGEGTGSATRGSEIDTIAGFEGVRGSAAADTMTGNGADNFFYVTTGDVVAGLGGNDTIFAAGSFALPADVEVLILTGTGNSTGSGGNGDDVITGNGGNNSLAGAGGNDTLDGGTGNDSLSGGDGNDLYEIDALGDQIVADSDGVDSVLSSVNFTLGATLERLTLSGTAVTGTGNASNNTIIGNAGNNTLDGGAGADSIEGGAGNDTFLVDSALDQATDSDGFDVVLANLAAGATFALGAGIDNLTLAGTAGTGGTGNALDNLITGNAGNNTLDGGAGNDTLVGGAGNDTYTIDSTGDVVTEVAAGGTADTLRTAFSTSLSGLFATLENLVLLGLDLVGIGNAAANAITGGGGHDYLSGGGGNDGNDTLDGGLGNDTLAGNGGNDTYVVDALGDTIIDGVAGGTDTVRAKINWTLASNLENLTAEAGGADWTGNGNELNNVVTGGAFNDSVFGGAGNDTLVGGLGNDTLDGGLGIDSMAGGDGNDTYFIDAATEKFSELANQGIDTIVSNATTVLAANFENLTLVGLAVVNGTGTAEANVLTGNDAANLLLGLAGNDSLAGAGGNDTLDGGVGNDTMAGGLGDDRFLFDSTNDSASEGVDAGRDTVVIGSSFALGDNLENLELTGAANINGTGNGLDNRIVGNTGANSLTGGEGNDTLEGGAGADTLDGGNGNDVFTWDPADAPYVGGLGEDTLRVTGTGQVINLGTLAGRFQDFERVDLSGNGNNTLTFDFDHLLGLSSTSDTLVVDGNNGDVVNSLHPLAEGEHWQLLGVEIVGDVFYISYFYQYPEAGPTLSLLVNQDVTQNIS